MSEIIINDGWCNKEERVIRIISFGEYDKAKVNESVDDLIRFFLYNVSSGFLNILTDKLNEQQGKGKW